MLVLNLAAHSFQCPSNPPRFATPRGTSPTMLGTEAEILAQIDALKAHTLPILGMRRSVPSRITLEGANVSMFLELFLRMGT